MNEKYKHEPVVTLTSADVSTDAADRERSRRIRRIVNRELSDVHSKLFLKGELELIRKRDLAAWVKNEAFDLGDIRHVHLASFVNWQAYADDPLRDWAEVEIDGETYVHRKH